MNKIKILFLELTQHCNLQCIFCDNKNIKRKRILKFDDIEGFDNMVESVEGDHVHSYIDISGYGEVMTHPDFSKFIKYFKNKKKNVRISTNGTLIDKFIDDIINSTIINMTISLNTLNGETYKKLMGKSGLKKVLSNVSLLKSKGFKGKIDLSFVINQYNFHEIPKFIDLGKITGSHIACIGLTPTLKEMYDKDLILKIDDEVRKKIEEYKNYAREKEVSFYIFNPDTDSQNVNRKVNITTCHYVDRYFFVGVSGKVVPCCWSKISMGNVKKESFNDIFNGEKYKKLRKMIEKGNDKYCKNCRKDG